MKTKITILALVLVAVFGGLVSGCNKPAAQKVGADIKETAQDTAAATKDALTTGKDKVVEVATNTATAVKQGIQKTGEVATNIAAKVKSATSNAWSDTKSATTNAVDKVNSLIH